MVPGQAGEGEEAQQGREGRGTSSKFKFQLAADRPWGGVSLRPREPGGARDGGDPGALAVPRSGPCGLGEGNAWDAVGGEQGAELALGRQRQAESWAALDP